MPLLDTYEACRSFAVDVTLALSPGDFMKTIVTEKGQEFDEYGMELGEELVRKYGLDGQRCWYLKLRVDEGMYEDFVTYISLHAPEWPMDRAAGVLVPDR